MVCLVSGQHAWSKSGSVSASPSCCMPQTAVHTKHLRWVSTGPGRGVGPHITRRVGGRGRGSAVIILVCAFVVVSKNQLEIRNHCQSVGAGNQSWLCCRNADKGATHARGEFHRKGYEILTLSRYQVALPIASVSPDPGPMPKPSPG